MSDKSLVLFTSQYPFGSSYTFIETELKYLLKSFKKIYIIPWSRGEGFRETPIGVEVVTDFLDKYDRNIVLRHYKWNFFKILSRELMAGNLFNSEVNHQISMLSRIFDRSHRLGEWIKREKLEDALFYSYWFNDWCTVLSLLKSKDTIENYYSRAHRYDLYEDRAKYEFIPFRRLQLRYVDKVFLVSDDGYEYLAKKYPAYRKKMLVSRLGTRDLGQNRAEPREELVVVSISRVVAVKRVELIAKSLSQVKYKVHWVHFGDGSLMQRVKSEVKKLPKNINCELKGAVSNDKIMKFLRDRRVDLFLNVSSSEGVPVSIMEAISFGIPVFATDAGGTREIVHGKTGKLFANDLNVEILAHEIENFRESICASDEFRRGVRQFWEENFSAQDNYKKFIGELRQ